MAMETVIPTRVWRWLAVAATLISALAIVGTYRTFSQTYDEPAHLASGIEYLSTGQYRYEAQHPPLARILLALGPYARGVRTIGKINQFYEGQLLLGDGAEYRTRLALARLGELPFFILICLFTWLWGRRLMGEAGGALGVLFVAANPNLLAHAGLATTDIAPAAAMVAVLYMYLLWREQPTTKRAIVLGATLGLAAVTKFSVIAFLGVALVGAELWFRFPTLRRPRSLGIALLCACVVIWAIYRFSFGPVGKTGVPVPAPELFRGLAVFLSHGTGGHPAFLLGSHSMTGWWYYFPVAIAVKTPLPILVFALLGCMSVVKDMRADRMSESGLLLIGIAGVLLIGMMTKVDIGIRHVLPLYPMLALVAARGALDLWRELSAARYARSAVQRSLRSPRQSCSSQRVRIRISCRTSIRSRAIIRSACSWTAISIGGRISIVSRRLSRRCISIPCASRISGPRTFAPPACRTRGASRSRARGRLGRGESNDARGCVGRYVLRVAEPHSASGPSGSVAAALLRHAEASCVGPARRVR